MAVIFIITQSLTRPTDNKQAAAPPPQRDERNGIIHQQLRRMTASARDASARRV